MKESDTGLAAPALWDLPADKQALQSEEPLQVCINSSAISSCWFLNRIITRVQCALYLSVYIYNVSKFDTILPYVPNGPLLFVYTKMHCTFYDLYLNNYKLVSQSWV